METNKEYLRVKERIQQLEQQQLRVDEKALDQFGRNAEQEIKEHFAQCVNALAARQEALLKDLHTQISNQKNVGGGAYKELHTAVEMQKRMLETGLFVYNASANSAENVWKEAMNIQVPQIVPSQIKLDLPKSILQTILSHGKVSQGTDTTLPNSTTQNTCSYEVFESVSTFAGSGEAGLISGNGAIAKFNLPVGLCLDKADNCLYLCDLNNHAIRKISMKGEVSTIVHGGLNYPWTIVKWDQSDNFVLTNQGGHSIQVLTRTGMNVLAGSGTAKSTDGVGVSASFHYPRGIAVDQQTGIIFVSDYNTHLIRTITPQGQVSTLAGSGSAGYIDGVGKSAVFNYIFCLLFDPKTQSLLACDYSNNKIRVIKLNGSVSTLCDIPHPACVIAVHDFYIVSSESKSIFKVTRDGVVTMIKDKAGQACSFSCPYGLAVHEPSQTVFVSEYGGHTIKKVQFA